MWATISYPRTPTMTAQPLLALTSPAGASSYEP